MTTNLFELFAELAGKVGALPVSIFGSWVRNTGTESGFNDDTGWLVGGRVNKAKAPGSWQFAYDYRELGADAVVGQFSNSDFIGGGTDGKGHRLAFVYQLFENVQAAATYLTNTVERSSTDVDYDRLQLDLMLKTR